MKKTTYLLGMLLAFQTIAFAQCPAPGYTCIPDSNFEQALIDFNYDSEQMPGDTPDGRILTTDAIAVTGSLSFVNRSIMDLTGIDAFINIDGLNVSYNPINVAVDLSSNTLLTSVNFEECNDLPSLTLLNLSLLNTINVYGTNLSTLDLLTNTALISLDARFSSLTSLNLSQNGVVQNVNLRSNNLTSVDMRNGNNANSTFRADFNGNLTCIYVDDTAEPNLSNWIIDGGSTLVETEAECATLGRESNTISQFNLYPNPATSQLTITSTVTNGQIEIFNITGKRVLFKNLSLGNNRLNVSPLTSGIYLARISAEGKTETKKLIIN